MTVFSYPFRKLSATATVFPVHPTRGLLLATRRDDVVAYPGCIGGVGGFQEAMWDGPENAHPGETIEEACVREIREEIGIDVPASRPALFTTSSHPRTDPRCHVLNVCFALRVSDAEADAVVPGDDIAAVGWTPFEEVARLPGPWAFDHRDLALAAVEFALHGRKGLL